MVLGPSGYPIGISVVDGFEATAITNNGGTIVGTGTSGDGYGILLESNASIASGIDNLGTIQGTGEDGYGIYVEYSKIEGGITNKLDGIIKGSVTSTTSGTGYGIVSTIAQA